ncbi:DgyrCDS7680 [Dimorphilus gyrociliatus]|uniref:DgyrCDS7680 n=1 Tax=Dimorphilus gyrociliatus TaxID=2664684 RepID=A0A7I8VRY3_9ANNE|nr:DgyrCDS7680 [Dimorphilus gyrociliatus]
MTQLSPLSRFGIVLFIKQAGDIEKECGTTIGCYREPDDCSDEFKCDAMITWKDNGDLVDFSMSAKTDYVALGLSKDKKMGDDSILACLKISGSNPRVEISYSKGQSTPETISNYNGITSVKTEVEDSRVRCSFSRNKAQFGSQVFNISAGTEYHLFVARGSVSDSKLTYHGDNKKITDKVDLTTKKNTGGSNAAPGRVKAHAALMTLAWAFFIPCGVFIARYYKDYIGNKDCKGVKLWFWLHRIFVLSGVLLSSIAFILIFVEVGGYSSPATSFTKAHPIVGIIVMSFAVINPIMGMLRPGLDSQHRSTFVTCHTIVGYLSYSLGFFVMMVGTRLGKINMPKWMLWVYFGHCMFYIALSILMRIADYATASHNKKITGSENVDMKEKGNGMNEKEQQAYPNGQTNCNQTNCSANLPKWLVIFRHTLFSLLFSGNIVAVFTDDNDEIFEKTGLRSIKTNCDNLHSRSALCCKMSYEFDAFLKSNKKWWCHVDDDTYVNVKALKELLSRYEPSRDWYIGRPSTSHPLEIDRDRKPFHFWFATGGAGFCISRSLALKIEPYAGGGKLRSECERIHLPDDCVIGYIIYDFTNSKLTKIKRFHSHLEGLWRYQEGALNNEITVSYSNPKGDGTFSNTINVRGFTYAKDPTRFLSLHCHLYKKCEYPDAFP